MNFSKLALLLFFINLVSPATSMAELPGVTVRVINISSTEGKVEVTLFNSSETFMTEPHLQQSGTADENGVFETEFVSLPKGEYAIVVVHDANDNGKLDTGLLGIGGEDYAFSNNARPWFGRPDFDQVSFTVDQAGIVVEVDLD